MKNIHRKCKICPKVFKVYSHRIKTNWFCSNECRGKWLKKKGIKPPPRTNCSPWNKGLKGWTKKTKAGFQKGKNNPNWKGGYYKGKDKRRWREWRKTVFERDNYTCQVCEHRGNELHPHHLKKWSDYLKLRYKVNNGMTLCKFCHKTYTKFGNNKKK